MAITINQIAIAINLLIFPMIMGCWIPLYQWIMMENTTPELRTQVAAPKEVEILCYAIKLFRLRISWC